MSERFSEDHPIEIIRGLRIPCRPDVLRSFAQRAAWLSGRMEFEARAGIREAEKSIYMRELQAIAIAVEAMERVRMLEAKLAAVEPANDGEMQRFADRFVVERERSLDKLEDREAKRAQP